MSRLRIGHRDRPNLESRRFKNSPANRHIRLTLRQIPRLNINARFKPQP
jgi:hypothetical protein